MLCITCKQDKLEAEMRSNMRQCKACYLSKRKVWLATPKGKAYRLRYRTKHHKQLRNYYEEWYKKNGRQRSYIYKEAIYEWQSNNPEKVKAHKILRHALIMGDIIQSKHCMKCLRKKRLSAHHLDYTKPLDVLWLCSSCHKNQHTKTPT